MQHYFADLPNLGNIAVSRHAQDQCVRYGITEEKFKDVLLHGKEVIESNDILYRQKDGIRVVILTKPTPNMGAKLVKTCFRIEQQAKAKK